MPTPVGTARQCLTQEAAHALDEAVAVARSRGHAQTTSLHMVSSLLSLPSSALREACSRTRKNAYSTRVQLKALELCLGVSLDRLASSRNRVDEPPVSNSLMAAVKRSQANQRRQPENFNFYQQQMQCAASSSSSAISVVKVELQNLIISILDDPVVSRVFGEAGFRSCDIKLAILRPVHQLFKYSRYKGPPMFLCNLDDSELSKRGFSFPFLGVSGVLDREENSRRIGEVMVRKKGKNPLLLGVCAYDALNGFLEMVKNGRGADILPVELSGVKVIRVENEILRFVNGDCDERLVKMRLDDVRKMVENCLGPGVVVNFGDLKALASDDVSVDALSYVVHEMGRLVEGHGGKVWLIGAAARPETYFKILNKFPSIEKDWDWHILPITSLRPSMTEQSPRSSLMDSFVPFGGFFSLPSEVRSPFSSSHQSVSRCHLCNENCEQEINALSRGGLGASIVDRYQSSLPLWMQMTRETDHGGLDAVQAKDDRILLSSTIAGLQRKWDSICERHHNSQLFPKATTNNLGCQIPSIVGFQIVEDRKNVRNDKEQHTNASSTDSGYNNTRSCTSTDFLQVPIPKSTSHMDLLSKDNGMNFLPTCADNPSKAEDDLGGNGSSPLTSSSTAGNGHISPNSATSVTTNLGLGMDSARISKELEKPKDQTHSDSLQDNSGCFSANGDIVSGSISNLNAQSSSGSRPNIDWQVDVKDFKMLYVALAKRIGHREEAVNIISQTIVRCKTGNGKRQGASRGDMWLNLHGPDTLGKKKLAIALSEILCGSRENLTSVDLSFDDEMIHTNALLGGIHVLNKYDVTSRGKTVVDYIAEKLSKRPLSVVFIENIEKADVQVQNNLSQALKTGRFSDSHGREVGISNAIFITTSGSMPGDKTISSTKDIANYTEENILTAKQWPIQIVIGFDLGDDAMNGNLSMCTNTEKAGSDLLMNKRKLIGTIETLERSRSSEIAKRAHKASNSYLDLNLPAEEGELCETLSGNSVLENSNEWLESFLGQFDEEVVFKPFNFNALAQEISIKIRECFNTIVISKCMLEIDKSVMVQILAAAYFTDIKSVEDWVHHVVRRGFTEAQKKYSLTARSVVKLVTCEGINSPDQTPTAFLPPRILLH